MAIVNMRRDDHTLSKTFLSPVFCSTIASNIVVV